MQSPSCTRAATFAAAASFALAMATAASAATLPFAGTFSIRLAAESPDPGAGSFDVTVSLTGSGVALVNGSGGGLHVNSLALAGGEIAGTASTPITGASALQALLVSGANGAGSFAGLSGGPPGGGAMPVLGQAKACLFGACASAVANLVVPLNVVGQGGAATVMDGPGVVGLTVVGAPWTTGAASVSGVTGMGFARGPLSGTSTTAQGSGVVRLVTPIFISTVIPDFPVIPGIGTLTLHFIPEPATLVLLGGGVGALLLGARRRPARISGAAGSAPLARRRPRAGRRA